MYSVLDIAPTMITTGDMERQDKEWHTIASNRVDEELLNVWVVYAWKPTRGAIDPNKGSWMLAGFRRRRNRRRKTQTYGRFGAKVRRQLGLDRDTHLKIMDLRTARTIVRNPDHTWIYAPPQHLVSTRPAEHVLQPLPKVPKRKVTRYKKSEAVVFHKKSTKYVALGKHKVRREEEYLYLGPLATQNSLAVATKEAERMFGAMYGSDIKIIDVALMSKRLKNAMHRGRKVRPGITRLRWPEPIAMDIVLTAPVPRISEEDIQWHMVQMDRLARRAAKSKKNRTKEIIHALAVLTFLASLTKLV